VFDVTVLTAADLSLTLSSCQIHPIAVSEAYLLELSGQQQQQWRAASVMQR